MKIVNRKGILWNGEDINIIHKFVHWNTPWKFDPKENCGLGEHLLCTSNSIGINNQWWLYSNCHQNILINFNVVRLFQMKK